MNKLSKIVCSLILGLTILLPQVVFAQTNSQTNKDTCATLRGQFNNAGGTNVVANVPAYCEYSSLYTKFINTALYFIGIVAVIAVIYGGYLYMTARGNEAQVKKGRSVLTWAIIGLIVVLAAAVIVNVVVNALVENKFV